MKILITGANGQLAREFQNKFEESACSFTALDKESLNITDAKNVNEVISNYHPDVLLNCAAYNFVDKAEEEDFKIAFRVNAEGVKTLAMACKNSRILLVHYSTDYVFDGRKEDFYTEDDEPNPINKYGESKLQGEKFLREEGGDYLLFRVSWVFGEGRQNFLYKLSEWAKKRKVLRIVCDQISVPTYTEDIVNLTMFAINKGLRGLYHLTNSGYASRYEVARYFLEHLGMNNLVLPANSDSFPSPAKRPYFSALSNSKLSGALNVDMPDWKLGIERYIEKHYRKQILK
jgi:dTDP-4-dehydrorhamnose reductase